MNPVNGLLLVDKPVGITSHDVVNRVRRILGIRSVGHAGTLDPLASGLMVLLIGEATKVSDYLLNGDKGYELKVRLGVKTDSMDMTGQVIKESPVESDAGRIREAALALTGSFDLQVPVHSAVKVDGKKLYEYAHKGQIPETVPNREMKFYDIEVIEAQSQTDAPLATPGLRARMRCSKGSFVRAWANRLGEDLGCGGAVEELRRLHSAPFSVAEAINLEQLVDRWENKTERHGRVLGPAWVPLKDALPGFRRIDIDGQDEQLLKNGQISKMLQAQLLQGIQLGQEPPPVRIISRETDDLLAILLFEPGRFYRIKRVFHRA